MSQTENSTEHESLVERGRKLVRTSAHLPLEALGFLGRQRHPRRGPPQGAAPGQMVVPEGAPEPSICVMHYDGDAFDERTIASPAELGEIVATPGRTAWIDVEGFGNRETLEAIGKALGIHPLAMADLVHVPQSAKVELHGDRLLFISQMARVTDAGGVVVEQVGLVLGPGWVASFQERPGDVFDPVRARIRAGVSRIRRADAGYLMYALLDAVIDGYFPVVEALAGVVEALEEEVIQNASWASLARIHATRRTLLTLHRVQWRQRDAVNAMLRDEALSLPDSLKPYLRDVHDHAFQTLDAIETYRDMVIGLMDLHLSSESHRTNEVMKTLTIVATVFIPLTFLTGVYGMNFTHMPELQWRLGYPVFWASMVALGGGLLLWFRRRGWLGSTDRSDD